MHNGYHSFRLSSVWLLVLVLFAASAVRASWAQVRPLPGQETLLQEAIEVHKSVELSSEALERIGEAIQAGRAAKRHVTPAQAKVSPLLLNFAGQGGGVSAQKGGAAYDHPLLRVNAKGDVQVYLRLTEASPAQVAALEAEGATIQAVAADWSLVVAYMPPSRLESIALLEFVQSIQPAVQGATRVGSVTTEGLGALNVDRVRAALGLDGTGVKICVVSDGTDGLEAAQAAGDLPGEVEICPLNDNSGAEGTAMLEIIHDLAPGAQLGFCPAFGAGQPGLADAITYLADEAFGGTGCDVIVDDVAFLTEPYFEDGIVAQAVDAAAAGGAAYFSAAGNDALQHYEKPYVDVVSGDNLFPFDAHDFGAAAGLESDIFWLGVVGNAVDFAPFNFFAAFLQWNDPFGASGNDYDLYLFDINGVPAGHPLSMFPFGALGLAPQDGDDDPLEVAFVVNETDQNLPLLLVVDRFAGDPNKLLEINFNGVLAVDPAYNVPEGSVWGHPAAEGAVAVGAINVNDPGLDTIEPFSARGPARIFFPGVEERPKPDLAAVDGVSVSGAGSFPTTFFGTSAAAPHAAAVAALLKQADASLAPDQLAALLGATAVDLGEPGFDLTFGAGRVDALAAALTLVPDETPPACQLQAVHPGPPTRLDIFVQDLETGIQAIQVVQDRNARVIIPPFTPGTTDPLLVTGEKIDQAQQALVVIEVIDGAGNRAVCDPVITTVSAEVPEQFSLEANYPNPFNPTTTIPFRLAEETQVVLRVYDAMGREVVTLVHERLGAGSYSAAWDGRNAQGHDVPSGLYLYRLETETFSDTRPMMLLK